MKKMLLFVLAMLAATQAFAVSVSYTLSSGATTSAGVYDSDGVLIRTLWNNEHRNAGTYTADWNGLDDNGILRPNGSYEIRVLSNNVQYTWDGVLGNTSTSFTDATRYHPLNVIYGMATANNTIYFATGYNEQSTASFKTTTGHPQQQTPILTAGASSYFVTTDGTNVYWAASDSWAAGENSFVYVTTTSTDNEASLSGAVPVATVHGRTYTSAINGVSGTGSTITGLAVQKNGDYLFVSRRALNRVDVLNKTTGTLVRTLTFNSPRALAVDIGNTLWMAKNTTQVSKYTINVDGTLTLVSNINNFSKALALALSPDSSTLLVADGGTSQRLFAYDATSSTLLWTYGEAGGYATGPNVTDDKFFFRQQILQDLWDNDWTFLAFQPDGRFWVGDLGNYRYQRYDANRNFIDRIQYMPAFYAVRADQNNGTRVFAHWLEFSVDYSKPLAPNNGSWTLVKNWAWTVPPTMNDQFTTLRSVTTLSNGRTYALVRHYDPPINGMEVVELPAIGNLVFPGVSLPDASYAFAKDGSLRHVNTWIADGTSYIWTKRDVSFDGSGNPSWGPLTTVVTSPPKTSEDPIIAANSWSLHPWEATSSGIVLAFGEGKSPGWHAQGLDIATGKWKWRSARSTNPDYWGPYPTDGSFDIGNTVNDYAGGGQHAVGRNIFWEYHGEFWKQDQANMWTHLYDDGLMVGLFGAASKTFRPSVIPDGTAGMAGNAFSTALVTAQDGSLYLYQNDESRHGGVHRWHVTGLDTIHEDTFPVTLANSLQTGLQGTYYDSPQVSNLEVVTTRIDPTVNFNWSTGIPSGTALTHADNFSVRWQGFIKPRYTESYTFYTSTDDGVRLWVNNQPVVDEWQPQTLTEYSGTVQLEANKLYPITLEYYEGVNSASASLSWSSASQSKEIVPSSQLFFVDTAPVFAGTNLLEGLRIDSGVNDGVYGWHRTPAVDSTSNSVTNWWLVYTSRYAYRWDQPADISSWFSIENGVGTISRDLLPASATNRSSWSLDGMIAFAGATNVNDYPGAPWGHGWYLDVLDDADKVIARLNPRGGDGSVQKMEGNGHALVTVDSAVDGNTWSAQYAGQPLPIQIFADSSGIRFNVAGTPTYTAPIFDSTSHWQKPRKLRLLQWEQALLRGHEVDLAKLTFTSAP